MGSLQNKRKSAIFGTGIGSLLSSLKQSFLFMVPVFMIGALALSIKCFPVESFRTFVETAAGGVITRVLDLVYNATYGLAAVYLVMVLSYYESQRYDVHKDIRVFAVVCSVSCYFGFMGPDVYSGKVDFLLYTRMANIFSALIVALGITHLFFTFYKLFSRKHLQEHTTAFSRGIRATTPFICCLSVSVLAATLISLVPGAYNFNDLVIRVINRPFESMGASFLGGFFVMLAISVLWMFGIHGSNVFDNMLTSPTGPFAFANGQIVSKPFIDTFVLMGGCGTSVCLLAALLLFGKRKKNRRLGLMSLIPAVFNINEPLIFGLPIVLNPIYAVPFILTPLVSYSIAYAATALGIVPQIINSGIQWTTPVVVSGYQATGSVAGSILQIVILAVGVAIYAPFIRLAEKSEQKNEARNIRRLTELCRDCEARGQDYSITGENTELRSIEGDIASKLENDIREGKICLYYQPQVKNGKIIAAEALLRFAYNENGKGGNPEFLYPPLAVGIACNYELFDDLSRAIAERALRELTEIQKKYDPDFHIAVNLRLDLLAHADFMSWLAEKIELYKPTPHTFGVEITEDANLYNSDNCDAIFDTLKKAGVEVLMDDFSMGHTSITVLQKNYFDYIKIDGSLIKQLDNERSRSIVASIIQLGHQLNFSVMAEYVETEKQRDILLEMGCDVFQGYLYYKAMPDEELKTLLEQGK